MSQLTHNLLQYSYYMNNFDFLFRYYRLIWFVEKRDFCLVQQMKSMTGYILLENLNSLILSFMYEVNERCLILSRIIARYINEVLSYQCYCSHKSPLQYRDHAHQLLVH